MGDAIGQMIINGFSLSAIYILIAVGLTVIFGIMRIIQYAHGEMYMLGAYFLFYWAGIFGLPYWAGLVLSVVVIFLFGVAVQLTLLRPLLGKGFLPPLALTLGLIFIISNSGLVVFGTVQRGIPAVITGQIGILGGFLSTERLAITVLAILILLGLFFFMQKTKTGVAMRAVSEDPDASSLQGIDNRRIHYIAFGIGSALAGLAGCMIGTLMSILPSMGFIATVKAFMIVIMGGLGSIIGCLVGGLILGFIDSFFTTLLGSDIAYIVAFGAIFVILVFKPLGLFGREWEF